MPLVAHVKRLGQQGPDIQSSALLERLGEHRSHHRVHPAQLFEHFVGVRAVSQDLPIALVQVREGPVAALGVLDHVHRHRGRRDPGHRSDRLTVMARLELDISGLDPRDGALLILRQALEQKRPYDRPAQRARSSLPFDGWSRVQEQPLVHAGYHLSSRGHRLKHGAGRDHSIHGRSIRALDVHVGSSPSRRPDGSPALLGAQPVEKRQKPLVAPRGRAPIHMNGCDPLLAQAVVERFHTEVDGHQRSPEQIRPHFSPRNRGP